MRGIVLVSIVVLVLAFGVIGCAQTPAPAYAVISVTQLSAYPTQIQVKEAVRITIVVANNGGMEGIYPLVLKINGVEYVKEDMAIAAHSNSTASYSATINEAGSYTINVGEVTASFAVAPTVPSRMPTPEYPVYNPPATQDYSQWQLDELRRQQQELQRLQDEQRRQMREDYLGLALMYEGMANTAEEQGYESYKRAMLSGGSLSEAERYANLAREYRQK
ncbi:hypothetical protein ACFLV6_03380, partial [Chloroflexota bacterium]